MNDIEKKLRESKEYIDNLPVPEELEDRLKAALDTVPERKFNHRVRSLWLIRHKALAAILVFVFFLGIYNYDVFAYYGKKILGYDKVTFGSIKQLNEAGMGQEINESYRFKNGTEVFLDGIMMDDNKLVAMYRIKGDSEEKINGLNINSMKGLLKDCFPTGGYGRISDDKKEIAWVQEFQAPSFMDKTLTFRITSLTNDVSRGETAAISFRLDRSKAVKGMVKSSINKTIEMQNIKYRFTSLIATPMSVSIEGGIEVATDKDLKLYETADPKMARRNLKLELMETYVKDGQRVTENIPGNMSSMSTGNGKINFGFDFDGLKPGIQKLVLNFDKVEDMRIIDKNIDVNNGTEDVKVVSETDELIIKNVRVEGGNTLVTFSAESDVDFGAALFIGDEQAQELQQNSNQVPNSRRVEKTYIFKGTGEHMKLMFKTLSHVTRVDKQIVLYEGK